MSTTGIDVRVLLDDVLSLQGRAALLADNAALLGAIPELDSMAVVSLITAIEQHFGIELPDDEIDGSVFATVGSLVAMVDRALAS